MIAIQLLASCFSVPQEMKTLTLPPGWYRQNRQIGTASRPVSSLRQHTQWSHSPAFGYHARNNSAESLCSTAVCETSREAHLSEHVSRNRLLKQTRRLGKKVTTRRRDRRVDHRGGNLSSHSFFTLHREGFKSTRWSASSQRIPPKGRRSQPQSPGQDQPVHGNWATPLQDDGHAKRSSALEPTLRSEGPPVFIQPIKQYVLKRWRTFCARNRHSSPTSASGECAGRPNSLSGLGRSSKRQLEYHRNGSSISKASVQLNRRYPILTLFQGSGSSVGMPPSEPTIGSFESPLEIALSATTEQRSHESNAVAQAVSHDYLGKSAIMLPTPRQKDEAHEDDAEDPSSCSQSQVPQESLGTLEAGQTRHRTSTSGTTIYHPPLIAEASPDSQKLNGDSSSSTVTAGGMQFLFL